MKQYLKPFLIGVGVGIILILLNKCNSEPASEPKTIKTVEYIIQTDTITKTVQSKPSIKYIDKTVLKDSIVYVPKDSPKAIEVFETNTILSTINGNANLNIRSLGEVLGVNGTITSKEIITTLETTKTKNKSGLFLYVESSIQPTLERVEVGLDYQIKNKIIIGTSLSYNSQLKATYINAKIGIKL